MENSNNSKNIIIAILLIIIIALVGFIIYDKAVNKENRITKNKNEIIDTEKDENNIDDVTALTLVQYLYNDAIEFYTFGTLNNCTWKTDNNLCVNLEEFWTKNKDGGFIKIVNYEESINNTFTENGKNQFEKFMKEEISTNPFIKKENNSTYILAPASGFYAGYTSRNMKISKIEKNIITATIDIIEVPFENSNNKETKKIIIKKENNKWLIDEFAIPMIY